MLNMQRMLAAGALLSMLLVCSAMGQDVLKHHDKLSSPTLTAFTDINGTRVDNQQGNNLGNVSDVIVDAKTGQVAYVVFARGGVLGVGSKLYPVPFQAMQYNKGDRFTLNISPDRLNDAPSFTADAKPDLSTASWRQRTDSFYQVQGAGTEGMAGRAGNPADQTLLRLGQIRDRGAWNPDGQRVGTVSNYVIDMSKGQVQYIVLGTGGVMGVGDKLHPVPWDVAKYNPSKMSFTVDASKDKLDNSPNFTGDKWPDMSDPAWKAQVDRYFSVQSNVKDINNRNME